MDAEVAGSPTAALVAAAALDRYEACLPAVAEARDTGAGWRLWCDLQGVRTALRAVPELSAAWLTLLISHHELLDALEREGRPAARLAAVQHHACRVRSISAVCRHVGERLQRVGARISARQTTPGRLQARDVASDLGTLL